MARKKQTIAVIGGLLVTALFVWLFVRGVNWGDLGVALSSAHYIYIVPAVLLVLATYAIKVWRWKIIMAPVAKPSYIRLYDATMIGFMGNDVLPARIGEFLRAVALRLRTTVPVSTALATIVVERIFDMLGVAFYTCLALWWLARHAASGADAAARQTLTTIRAFAVVSGLLAVGILAGLVVLRLCPRFSRRLTHAVCLGLWRLVTALAQRLGAGDALLARLGRVESRLEGLVDRFIDGLAVIRTPLQGAGIFLLTLVHWAPLIVLRYVLAKSFDGLSLTWGAAALVFVFNALAVALPQAPGYLGTFQLSAVAAVTLAVGPRPDASAYAIILWAVEIIPVILIGLGCLWVEGLTFRELRRQAEVVEEAIETAPCGAVDAENNGAERDGPREPNAD